VTLKHTPLYDEHLKLGAKIVEFGGWAMPLQYQNLIAEHKAVRSRAGIFDAGHMGVVKFNSAEKLLAVQRAALTRYLDDMEVGQIRYNRLRNAQGGIADDILVYKDYEHFLAVFNAANTQKDLDFFAGLGVGCEPLGLHIIAVQGPQAEALVQKHTDEELDKLKYYTFLPLEFGGYDVLASKTGYTGERGFELMVPPRDCPAVWRLLLDGGAVPCGLGARDTLRIEAGMPLYGHELRDSWTSEQSDSIIGLKMLDKAGIPRQGYQIFNARERLIGEVTSGTFSPTLNEPIAMAYLAADAAKTMFVNIRGKMARAKVTPLPFYSNVRKKKKEKVTVPEEHHHGRGDNCDCGSGH
jgi:aminomethyltransferase